MKTALLVAPGFKGRFTRYDFCRMRQRLTAGPRHNLRLLCRSKKCRSILKHVLTRCDNYKSRRRPVVRLSHATKIVPCKSALTDFLVLVLCNVHIRSHLLNEQQEQITLLEGGKLWFSPLNGESLEPIVLPWKCHSGHIMELCDECNYCTEFQF